MKAIKEMWIDEDPISNNKYKYVFWQSILLIMLFMGTYLTLALAHSGIVVIIGVVLFALSIFTLEKFNFNLIKIERIKLRHLLYVLIATMITNMIYWTTSAIIGQPSNQMVVYQDLREFPLMISIMIFVILGPIFEEIIFRGFLLKGIFKGHLLIGFIVSSVLFGLIHGPTSVGEFTIYLSLGLIFGAVYLITRRIEASILCHSLNNLIHILIFVNFYK
nr:type II CAAX endopeptidase family protein [Mammaliicoccus sp. Marseille-Q6498]